MNSVESLANAIKPMMIGQNSKPHKFALVLAIIDLFEEGKIYTNRLILDEELESYFHLSIRRLDSDLNEHDTLIEYPFYSLSKDGYWSLKVKPGMEDEFYRIITELKERFTKRRIKDTVEYAQLSDEFMQVLSDKTSRDLLRNALMHRFACFNGDSDNHKEQGASPVRCYSEYLTSLISTNIFNENAIAEAQAVNPLFGTIHTTHPLVHILDKELRQKTGKHVILTGHAGDGKTTIAVDIIKQLRGLPLSTMLEKPIERREEIEEHRLSIIKDFSEREGKADQTLIEELKAGQRRFMIISNTGTLLDFFKGNAQAWQINSVEAESRILTAISQKKGAAEVEFAGVEFIVYNLAYIDNLKLAENIFTRMLEPDNWIGCGSCSRESFCPMKHNVELIRSAQEQVTHRLFLLYRRLYEYGTRLTIRQLTSHLAYIISSGINAANVHKKMSQMKSEYLFFNRIFGDDGKSPDVAASEMKAIVELKRQSLGTIFNSGIEMNLWLKPSVHGTIRVLPEVKELFSDMRKKGMASLTVSGAGSTPEQARRQLRRLLYFFVNDEVADSQVMIDFLNSPNILYWQEWQQKGSVLEKAYRAKYTNMVFHVIQEHFTGVRMPEGMGTQDSRLYITLSRKQSEVRQSAQIVIAELDWSQSVILELDRSSNAAGAEYVELALKGQGVLKGVTLRLGLPFLDYVTQRHYGEIGNLLNAAYKERLEHFKLQVLKKTASLNDDMMLVRLRNDNRFKRQKFSISDQAVEVFDV